MEIHFDLHDKEMSQSIKMERQISAGGKYPLPLVPSLPPPASPPQGSPISRGERARSQKLLRRASTGSLSLISSRGQASEQGRLAQSDRSVLPSSGETPRISVEKRGDDVLRYRLLPKVEGLRASLFNLRITSHLRKEMTEDISCTDLDVSVSNFCRSSMNDWFLSSLNSPGSSEGTAEESPEGKRRRRRNLLSLRSKDLVAQESPRARRIWVSLQRSDALCRPFFHRIEEIRRSLISYCEYKKTRTEETDSLLSYLTTLSASTTLEQFLQELDSPKWSLSDRKIGQYLLGSKKKSQDKIRTHLQTWRESSAFHRLRSEVRLTNGDLIAMASIPKIDHLIPLSSEDRRRMDTIEVREILRCIYLSGQPIYDRISIGNTILASTNAEGQVLDRNTYLSNLLSLLSCENVPAVLDRLYLFERFPWSILRDTYQQLSSQQPEVSRHFLIEASGHSLDDTMRNLIMTSPNLVIRDESEIESCISNEWIPPVSILRLFTNSWWGIADRFIRRRFPGLFSCPYWSRLVEGISLHVEGIPSVERSSFCISQTKTYAVYHRIRKDDPQCMVVNKEVKLATFTFRCNILVDPRMNTYVCILQCPCFWVNPHLDIYEKDTLIHALVDYEED